jgi:hypothetical protein
MSIVSEIKKSNAIAFRRIYMKRRSYNDYESSWNTIPSKYIRNYGNIDIGIEGIKVNFFKFSGYNFKVDNVDGYFSDVTDDRSFFYGYTCIPRTLVKVEAGYIASDGTEYPTNSTLFVGIVNGNIDFESNNLMDFNCDHLSQIFDEFNADAITSFGGNYTASQIFTKIKNHQDSNAVSIFQKYISIGAWHIDSTTTQYAISTNTSLQGLSLWEFMTKIAEAENKTVEVDRTGEFYFRNKIATQSTSVFHFSGIGDNNHAYGHNIMDITNSKKYNKVYNRIRIRNNDADTISSYYTKAESWSWGDSTSSYLYGVKTYNVENIFIPTATCSTIADNIYNEYVNPKYEVRLKTKFVPHLNLNDLIDVTYKTKQYFTGDRWDEFQWGFGFWGYRTGYNINLETNQYRIIQIHHDIESFYSTIDAREA